MTLKDIKQESDKESLNKYTDEIELNEKHLSLIYDALSDAIFLLAVEPDDRFRFVSVNLAFLAVTGLSKEQVVGKRIEQVLPETAHALVISKYKEAISDNKTVFWEEVSTYPTGERVGAVTVTPVCNAEGVCTHLVGTVHDLTEHKRAEETLRESGEKYRVLFETAKDAIFLSDEAGKFVDVNQVACESLGYTKEELLKLSNKDIDADARGYEAFLKVRNGLLKEVTFEVNQRRKDRSLLPVEITGSLFTSGSQRHALAIARDVTERKRVEEREKEAVAAAAAAQTSIDTVEAVGDGVFLLNMDGKITSVNPAFGTMTGYEPSELVEQSMDEMIPKWFKPEDIEKSMGLWRTMSKGKSPVPEALTWITKDGGEVPTIFTVSFIRDAKGTPTTVVVAIKDISELKRAEEALRESEQWLSTTLRSIGDAVIATDARGLVTLMNPVAGDLTGWGEAEAVGKPLEDVFNIINEQTGKHAENPVAKVLREGIVVGLANHTALIARDGTKCPIADSGAPMRDEEGNIIGTVMVFRDITESKRAEEALRESEEKFRIFAEQSPNMIFVNSKGRVVYANKKSEEIMGYSKEEFYSPDFDFLSLLAPESVELVTSCFGKHMKGEAVKPYEYTLITRKGTRIEAINATGLIRYKGEPAILGITTDITERKRMEEELVRKEKLASIGQLASGLGHELRNPLGVIGNSTYYLNMKLKDADEKVQKHIAIQQREVNRANKIITDLLDFSRVRPPSLEEGNANSIIKDTLADIKVPENISVETHLNEELPGIIVDPDQIRQVFLNLISNAVQAMPEGGRLDMKTGVKDDFAEIILRDTGEGIPEEHLQKIFEPLFTRKAKGIGLGLSIVKGIVEAHKGKIKVESELGEGTTFTIKLPLQRIEERGV